MTSYIPHTQSLQPTILRLCCQQTTRSRYPRPLRLREAKTQPQHCLLSYRSNSIPTLFSCHNNKSSSLSIRLLTTSMHPWPISLLPPVSQGLLRVLWTGSWSASVMKTKDLDIASYPTAQVSKGYVCTPASHLVAHGSSHRDLVLMLAFHLLIFVSLWLIRLIFCQLFLDHISDPAVKRLDGVNVWTFLSQVLGTALTQSHFLM